MKDRRSIGIQLVCLAILFCTCLTSCGVIKSVDLHEEYPEKNTFSTTSLEVSVPGVPSAGGTDESPDRYNSETQLADLPAYNCEGQYFIILTMEDNHNLFPDETEYISASAYKRNNLVQEKYNVQIIENAMTPEALTEYVESSELSGSYYADLICVPSKSVKTFYDKELIDNFEQKPYYVADRPYFDTEINARLNEGYDGTYALYCDTLVRPDDIYCIFYNRANEGAKRIGEYSTDLGESAFLALANQYKAAAFDGCSLFEDSLELTFDENRSAEELFLEGEVLFFIDRLGKLDDLSSKTHSLGLLPLPADGDGAVKAYSDPDELYVFCYPSGATLDKRTLLVTMALGAAGCDYNLQAATEYYLDYVQDNSSALMLRKLLCEYALRN